ncbi:hypothetical protein D623_10017603 [Myotis brandtii]|uniref:Uncharacterized protein n=1 Tax=Myotis brandtii TaxID=109478 RepID=S7PYD5_MYOBR|nr:hypothetical protein D623_10017603 [Myotis brandtii]
MLNTGAAVTLTDHLERNCTTTDLAHTKQHSASLKWDTGPATIPEQDPTKSQPTLLRPNGANVGRLQAQPGNCGYGQSRLALLFLQETWGPGRQGRVGGTGKIGMQKRPRVRDPHDRDPEKGGTDGVAERPEREGKDPERGGDRDPERDRDPEGKVRDGGRRYTEGGRTEIERGIETQKEGGQGPRDAERDGADIEGADIEEGRKFRRR